MAEKDQKKNSTKTESNESVVIAGVHTHKSAGSIIWAMFLLFIGVMFLLNTTGVINWNVWAVLWKFWPVFLILSGARLLLGSSKIASWVIGILAFLCFSFIAFTAYVSYSNTELNFLPSSFRDRIKEYNENIFVNVGEIIESEDVISSDEYEDVKEREVSLRIGASEFTVVDKDDDSYFYSESKYYENFGKPVVTSSLEEGVLDISFVPESKNVSMYGLSSSPVYDIQMGSSELLTSFDIDLGAGEGTLDLDDLLIKDINASVGAGAMNLYFTEDSLPSGTLTVEVGAGDVEIHLPSDVAFDLDYDLGVGEISSNGDSIATFAGSGDDYQSSNYDSAEKTVKIVVSVGVGALSIDN